MLTFLCILCIIIIIFGAIKMNTALQVQHTYKHMILLVCCWSSEENVKYICKWQMEHQIEREIKNKIK